MQPAHVHLVVSFPPKYSIAQVVQLLKAKTGRALQEQCPFLQQRYYGAGGLGSVGYVASTVGLDEEWIKRYVRYQEKKTWDKRSLPFKEATDVIQRSPDVSPWKLTYRGEHIRLISVRRSRQEEATIYEG